MKKNVQGQRLVIALLVLVILGAAFFLVLPNLSTINLFQGQQAGVVGIQLNGGSTIPLGGSISQSRCFSAENDPYVGSGLDTSCTWKWISTSPVSPTIYSKADLNGVYNDQVQVDYSVGNLVAQCSAGNLISAGPNCASVPYETTVGNNATGYLVPYQFSTDISVDSNSGAHITFKGVTFVNEILNFLWNNLPSGYQMVNQSSIYASVSACTVQTGSGTNPCSTANLVSANLNPQAVGSQVELFLDQNLQNQVGATCPSGNCLPSANNPFPSTYMSSEPVYFGITLSNVGAYSCGALGLSTCWPSIHLVLTVYTFLVGTYIPNSVNPVTQTQSQQGGGNNKGGNPFNWLNNPFNLAILEIIVILVVVAVIAVTVLPRILAVKR